MSKLNWKILGDLLDVSFWSNEMLYYAINQGLNLIHLTVQFRNKNTILTLLVRTEV